MWFLIGFSRALAPWYMQAVSIVSQKMTDLKILHVGMNIHVGNPSLPFSASGYFIVLMEMWNADLHVVTLAKLFSQYSWGSRKAIKQSYRRTQVWRGNRKGVVTQKAKLGVRKLGSVRVLDRNDSNSWSGLRYVLLFKMVWTVRGRIVSLPRNHWYLFRAFHGTGCWNLRA